MKTALVTGASSGFGFETVVRLLQQDWRVIAALKDLPQESQAFKSLQAEYPHTLQLEQLDLTQATDYQPLLAKLRQLGQLDLLVNNAGFGTYGALLDLSEAQIRQQFEVNFFGPLLLTKSLIPLLQKSQGRIITVTSIMAQYSMPLVSLYSASKYALEGWSEGLYQELKPLGIQVCTLQPGGYRTPFYRSLVWGEQSFAEHSPYKQMGLNFQAFMHKLALRPKAPHPAEVAEVILRLIQQPQMPRSLVVGKDARLIATLRKLCSQRQFQHLIARLNKKILGDF